MLMLNLTSLTEKKIQIFKECFDIYRENILSAGTTSYKFSYQ